MSNKISKPKVQIVEPIELQDFSSIIDLIEDNIVQHDTPMEWLESFASGEIKVAKIEGKIVGFIMFRFGGRVFDDYDEKYISLDKINCSRKELGYIVYIVVGKEHQGKGIAKRLAKIALDSLKKTGAKAVGVHCWAGSPGKASEKFFKTLDFDPIKLHKRSLCEYSRKLGPEGYWCVKCGNPCKCDELEMVKYL